MLSSDRRVLAAQQGVVRVVIDATEAPRMAVRRAIGQRDAGAPYLAFFDRTGGLVTSAAIRGWHGAQSADRILASLAKSRQ